MAFYTIYNNLKDKFTPLLKESRFYEAGVLTPEEFVQAGDFLVSKCPTWSWYDKQYLITKNVPCIKRAKDMEYVDEEMERIVEDEWIETYYQMQKENIDQVEEIDSDMKKLSVNQTKKEEEIEDIEDLDELEEMADDNFEIVDDPNALNEDNILKTRTYNIR
ncbi:hypothetical protein PIROE2DRAFT_12017 [Piromyces sp. E2]|nr:hypothetical protein PIROE2DRAFT_12017 [Piromyces sp. E2]|eukprot:OUM61860.1 hypothetical protein PIROE2DRAFT_12017 [Piromyces sp. E2]